MRPQFCDFHTQCKQKWLVQGSGLISHMLAIWFFHNNLHPTDDQTSTSDLLNLLITTIGKIKSIRCPLHHTLPG